MFGCSLLIVLLGYLYTPLLFPALSSYYLIRGYKTPNQLSSGLIVFSEELLQ
ncbi:hypothetical protein DAPPUDRAFT_304446 [Daphnia pulex]|uniref:Uncharacterized protein n=1 Tax=Daphnia pulex TaxID=6669 RepID=E9GLT3_DAPPU|nr:hypothetical protein DAPPUDRAFT_304446 [Daphnia pulex]|eukprot:EFX79560.1 hypothetical protein DAPPUDRAFT_304446 [Daphnia pulex]